MVFPLRMVGHVNSFASPNQKKMPKKQMHCPSHTAIRLIDGEDSASALDSNNYDLSGCSDVTQSATTSGPKGIQ